MIQMVLSIRFYSSTVVNRCNNGLGNCREGLQLKTAQRGWLVMFSRSQKDTDAR
jgi:hypothetical protein